jgi:Fe2+ or Zn2+ uptake regulation protein
MIGDSKTARDNLPPVCRKRSFAGCTFSTIHALCNPTLILIGSRLVSYVRRMTSDFEAQLRAVSLRVTRPRVAVLAALRDHPHVDTDTVIALVRAEHPAVSHQAVYDVLRALTNAGLVRRIQPAGVTARYESRAGDNHHHVVCRSCGAIADVDCAVGDAPCLTASNDHGFVVTEAEVVYWGTCPDCATAPPPSKSASSEGNR